MKKDAEDIEEGGDLLDLLLEEAPPPSPLPDPPRRWDKYQQRYIEQRKPLARAMQRLLRRLSKRGSIHAKH
jgi:hypothetical protein